MKTSLIAAALGLLAAGSASAQPAPADAGTQRTIVNQYCVTCHNARLKTANLLLDQVDLSTLGDHPALGEKIVRKLRAGLMPPTGNRRPDAATYESLIRGMEATLDRSARPHLPPPGLHRLNRTEYTNAIRDLLALEIDAAKFLPSDDSTRGFDNIAGALTMSPALMEAYLSAAGKISRLAIGDAPGPAQVVFDVPGDTAQNYHVDGLPFGTRGGMLIEHEFPADGEYSFKVKGVTGYFQAVLGGVKGEQLEVTIDGERVKLFDWDKEIANTTGNGRSTPRVPVKAGLHKVGVTFLATNDIPGSELNKPFQRTMNTPGSIPGFLFYPHVGQVWIEGPYDAKNATDTASRRKIFSCRPSKTLGEEACARRILSTLARHAYRRPATAADVKTLMEFYQEGRSEDGTFDGGIEAALQRVLADPEFVYRGEREPVDAARKPLAPGAVYRVRDIELASRLSFFLWSSIPDDELLDAASKGLLRDPKVLQQQVKRMLADPKSEALTNNFAGQWLFLRDLARVQTSAANFDDNLRQSFRTETEMLFANVVHEDESLLRLLDAKYTFVDERLAKHYGIPNVHGSYFRRVELSDDSPRRGVLGQGSILTVTSVATRTSPVTRGRWILENLLGTPAPIPPPGVDTNLEKNPEEVKNTSLRHRLEMHRTNPPCASCHKIMDPIGFALENFDLVGTWRDVDGKSPVDASGQLVDGTKLNGPADLRAALLSRSDAFVTNATEKLFTYALGRPVQYFDMPAVRAVVHRAAQNDYRFSSLVLGVVSSDAFQMKMKKAPAASGH